MSSYIATTRHETEPSYAIDTFFSNSNYSSPTEQRALIVTSSPTNQTTPVVYDCLPPNTSVSTIPIENLSITNEWMSPIGLNYSEYNQQDMNFLFAYNELVIENKDNVGHLPLQNFNQKDKKSSQFEYQKSAEQSRRFSMMESRGDNLNYMPPQRIVGSSSFSDYNPYIEQEKDTRSSMPNVFNYAQVYNNNQHQQQSQFLQKRPVNSDYMPYNPSSSVSLPLKKHTKKRSMVDQILTQDEVPCVVSSSTSEPIPTCWMQSRKRTKSIQADCIQEQVQETYDIMPSSDESNQVLAAMPRRQKLRYEGDHYTPKWVRYTGHLKEGYCDSCNPGKWLQLKNSAYWYHKQFFHGISSVSGKSFMKPIEQRMGKGDMIEGLCHQCHRFVPACNGKKKNNYMLWYRHAHKCHLYDKPKATLKTMRKTSLTCSPTLPKQ